LSFARIYARSLVTVTEHEVDVGVVRVFYRRRRGDGTPTVFVHGNPTSSAQWRPFLEAMSGPALAPDIPGWGESERPDPSAFDYSMHGLAGVLGGFLDALDVGEYNLVAQDWGGGFALINAQRSPERVRRLVLIDSVPLLPGYRWHRTARIWRTRGSGVLQRVPLSRSIVSFALREARADRRPMPPEFVDMVVDNLRDRVTQKAILALYRSADPPALAAAGSDLSRLRCPALVLWGARDPYLPPRFAKAYADALGGPAEVEVLDDAGHWAWIDRPDVVMQTVGFLESS
jgi:pimeloyl-ACP methyl ester carboxylesterase